ncbi:IS630 family transposase domain protein [Rickettsiales endosymbiont of Paramecium tredecaurelia]|nr:IS630 family transposase domain protein [Candidatus Sarmatiella mevalonica]
MTLLLISMSIFLNCYINCKVLWSPDLNFIEKFWANMKCWIKGRVSAFDKLYDALNQFFVLQTST